MPTTWRPHPGIRAVAIGVIRRGADLLVVAVQDDAGAIKGWRPLGGTIEFGERAPDTLKREFVEELRLRIAEPTPIAVLENLYEHHCVRGHEIVFVFETAFTDSAARGREAFQFHDGGVDNHARWIAIDRFRSGDQQLFPAGLIQHI